jgi:hypothetical protein
VAAWARWERNDVGSAAGTNADDVHAHVGAVDVLQTEDQHDPAHRFLRHMSALPSAWWS